MVRLDCACYRIVSYSRLDEEADHARPHPGLRRHATRRVVEQAASLASGCIMFGLTFEKLLIIGIIAAILIGPDRLPRVASYLAAFIRGVKKLAETGKERLREEIGDDVDDIDWKTLDPRQYDPRRIVREAVTSTLDDESPEPTPKPPPPPSRYRPRNTNDSAPPEHTAA